MKLMNILRFYGNETSVGRTRNAPTNMNDSIEIDIHYDYDYKSEIVRRMEIRSFINVSYHSYFCIAFILGGNFAKIAFIPECNYQHKHSLYLAHSIILFPINVYKPIETHCLITFAIYFSIL